MKSYIAILIFSFVIAMAVRAQNTLQLVQVIGGISSPTAMAFDSIGNFYITQREGTIAIADPSGNLNAELFLDITDRVKSQGQEQGLLGICLHPGFNNNGYFYVNYTGEGDSTHISRFERDPADPARALPESEFKLLTIYQPFQNHNGGELRFGPDLYLYIGMGDGGSGGDPGNRAQSKGTMLGKILRIDVNAGSPYAVPPDNPFVTDPLARPEIWSYGWRNPWRFSFDRLTGDMWIADVGQGEREEINMEPEGAAGGLNYGWRCYEGSLPYNTDGCGAQGEYVFPVHEYSHDATSCWSVTGGFIYRGNENTGMIGKYYFSDYCHDIIWSLHDSAGVWAVKTEGTFTGNNFSSFGEDRNGEIYIAGLSSGKIYRLADTSATGVNDPVTEDVKIWTGNGDLYVNLISEEREFVVRIFDMNGKELFSDDFRGKTAVISTKGYSQGLYVVQVKSTLQQHFWEHQFKIILRNF